MIFFMKPKKMVGTGLFLDYEVFTREAGKAELVHTIVNSSGGLIMKYDSQFFLSDCLK